MRPTSIDGLDRGAAAALRRLLLAATTSVGRDQPDPSLAELVTQAPVHHLPAAAALHRVGGCVHQALAAVPGVPGDVLAALAEQRTTAALRHLMYSRALVEAGRALDAEDVPWLAMKGPVLASAVYGDPGLRTYGDLDLLIGQRALGRATAVLDALGYVHSILNWPVHQWFMASEFQMTRREINLDVHWHVIYARWERRYFSIAPGEMLERSQRSPVAGHPVPTFDPVDTLLHLCLHASRSGGHRVIWFKDIERAIAVQRPDLDELIRRARSYRCGPPVALALDRARRFVGADVPPELVAALSGAALRATERLVDRVATTVRFDERDSLPRFLARSTRSRLGTSVLDLGERTVRAALRRLPRGEHETGDRSELQRYLDAVAAADLRPPAA